VIIPLTSTIIGPAELMALRNADAVVTRMVGPPAPPEVPFCPKAFTLANPSAWPGCGGVGLPVGDADGEGGLDGDADGEREGDVGTSEMVGPGPAMSVTTTSSNEPDAKLATKPTRPLASVPSVTLTAGRLLTKPRRLVPNVSSRST